MAGWESPFEYIFLKLLYISIARDVFRQTDQQKLYYTRILTVLRKMKDCFGSHASSQVK